VLQSFYELTILTITSSILFYVAVADLQNYKIRNEMVQLLAALYLIYVMATGTWNELPLHLGIASVIFVALLICYNYKMVGGGDVKLLTVAFLWTGKDCALLFAVAMLGITIIHTGLAYFGIVNAQTINGRKRIAYAPAIAGALVVVFVSDCLQMQ
jgi:prepilin peptidase CpaA